MGRSERESSWARLRASTSSDDRATEHDQSALIDPPWLAETRALQAGRSRFGSVRMLLRRLTARTGEPCPGFRRGRLKVRGLLRSVGKTRRRAGSMPREMSCY